MTNRLDASSYDTDKALHAHYLRSYEQYFGKLQDREVRLLELGVYKGGSLLLWRDYFQKGLIVGLDLNPIQLADPSGRIRTYAGQQQDTSLLDRIGAETAPGGFDVIIDDCSHIGELTRISFWHLFDNHLKPGGLYVIEDWSTGYWDSWFDGVSFQPRQENGFSPGLFRFRSLMARVYRSSLATRVPLAQKLVVGLKRVINGRQFRSHDYGLVGFIKELVDECGMADITRPDLGKPPQRRSKFQEMRISPGQVFIIKASEVTVRG
ncbi:MAG: class I SAM-dependent methyltransferase [Pyrinomonadaceae bacterium]